MSRENVEVVMQSIAALNERDIDRYLAGCSADIQMQTPFGSLEAAGIRRYWAKITDSALEFRVTVERLESIGADRVLAFSHATATAKASSTPLETAIASVYDLADGKIRSIQIFLDRHKALEVVGLRE
jgi:ketosteroid isomerase-like protein